MSAVFTSDNFQTDVLNADKPVLVDFWAEWCQPCLAQGPIIDTLAERFKDKVMVGKLNVEESNEIAIRYNVMAIPTILIFKGGDVVERLTGLRQEDDLAKIVEQYI